MVGVPISAPSSGIGGGGAGMICLFSSILAARHASSASVGTSFPFCRLGNWAGDSMSMLDDVWVPQLRLEWSAAPHRRHPTVHSALTWPCLLQL